MSGDFVHLHTHSEYSLLDGLGRVKNLVAEAKRLGHPALAITDHGAMHGAVEFFRAAKKAEIKPIIGLEAYQTVWGRPMGGRDSQFDKENYHLLLLARNMTGYRNLLKISSHSHTNGFYYKPRIDHDFLEKHAEGLVATTGCLGAEVPQLLEQGREKEAYDRLGWYVDLFGKENFFIEIQEHAIPELVRVNKILVPWADKFGLQMLVTNDVHYVREEDGGPHDVLLCVQTSARFEDEKRMRLSDGSYFMKSRRQLEETFRPYIDLPASAYDNSLLIAEMCDVDLEDKEYHLPDIPIPEGFNYSTYLRHLTEKGLAERYGERALNEDVQARMEKELRIIDEMGFAIYFLIVADLCDFARSRNIWWNVRGSGAGSIVAYCIGITGLDPLKNNLIFERFLNPGRVTMPDFDLDYPDDQREELIRYTVEKYGSNQVAQIVTFGRMKARAAIRDVGRVKDIPLHQVDRIAKLIPGIPGKPVTIQDVLTEGNEFYNPELKDLANKENWVRDLLDTSMQLEGVARHSGIHAAAVIVADRDLTHYTPLMRGSKSSVTETVTQYEFPILESIGLLKVDFLGLSTLSVMREAGRLIQERHGIEYKLDNIPFEGEPARRAFDLLSSGEVSGVFQVESQGMRRVLTEMRPTMFEHIIATISLYRPGPIEYIPNFIRRMHGDEEVEFRHPELESILGETYGICVSGDALITDARSGRRYRLDEIGDLDDFMVQGVDDQLRPAVGRVTHWIDSGHKPVFEVTLRSGATVKVTEDHRLLTEAGWLPLKDLAVGDFIATPHQLIGPDREEGAIIDRRRLRILAYLIADGSLASMASADFVSKNEAMLAEYERCLSVFGDVRPVFTPQVHGVTRIGVAKDDDDAHYHAPNSLLAWLRELGLKHGPGSRPGGLRSHEKSIPGFVFELDQDDLAYFVASLWDCDGYMGSRLSHYRTISQQLASDVQHLLLRLGIRSTIYAAAYQNSDSVDRQAYQITVYDTKQLADRLQPHMVSEKRLVECKGRSAGTVDRGRFIEEVDEATDLSYLGLMQTYGIDRQHFYAKRRQSPRIAAQVVAPLAGQIQLPQTEASLNVFWDEILSVEPAGVEHVYDLTVEGLHNFVANNIIVHNCVYQEQIIQILSQLAGYTPGEADLVRRAISKKKASEIERHKNIFVEGCAARGIPKDAAKDIYADIEFFARYGFNKCLPGDVEIVDPASGRMVRIEDLYTGAAKLDSVVTCEIDDLTLRAGPVAQVMDNGIKPVFRLTTASGRQIEATANHPFYTFDGWRLLEEIALDDLIAVPRSLPVKGSTQWPDHEVIALGHLLAEGNLCHPHSVYFYSQDPAQVDDYVAAANAFDNVACSQNMHKETWAVYAKRVDRSRPPGIVTWAKDLEIWGKTAHTKEIPAAAFELTNRQIGLLLSRMWEGDGHLNEAGRSLFYATASQRMARQMQHLFLRLGILSRLRTVEFPYKDGRTGYQLFVTGNANLAAFAHKVGVHFISQERRAMLDRLVLDEDPIAGTKDIVPLGVKEVVRAAKAQAGVTWTQLNAETGVAQREFYPVGNGAKTGYHRNTIGRLADYFADTEQGPDLRRYADNDIYWDRVVEITSVGEKQTYDLEVPGTHNFIANDILVHNSHAADYAVITVQTAFLKATYPVEYMAALLLIERDKTDKVINFINECRRMGIQVLPPDVNYSGLDFEIQEVPADSEVGAASQDMHLGFDFPVAEGSAIRYGMAAVKNVGAGPVQVIIDARDEGGPFASLEEFCDRTDLRQVGKRALECLIKVGAFDRFGARSRLLAVMDEMVARSAGIHSARESGQLSMFDLLGGAGEVVTAPIVLPKIEEAPPKERLQWEKELVGVYVTSHPLEQVAANWQRVVTCSCAELDERYHDRNVVMAGMINGVRSIFTKKGDSMAFVQLEDLKGQVEVVVFPRTYAEFRDLLEPENVILVKGKAQTREGRTSVLADTIQNFITVTGAAGDDESSARQPILMDLPTINGVPVASADIVADLASDLAGNLVEDLDFSGPDLGEDDADGDDLGPTASGPMILPAQDSATIADDLLNLAPPPDPYWDDAPAPKGKPIREAPAPPMASKPEVRQPVPAAPPAPKADSPAPTPLKSEVPAPVPAPAPAPAPKRAEPADVSLSAANGVEPGKHGGADGGDDRGDNQGGNGGGAAGGRPNGGRTIRIVFQRSGNLDRDKYRLKEIYDRVRDPRGKDHFAIVVESHGQRHLLQFPDDPCTISDRLVTELTKHFRLEVHVE